MKKRLLVYIPPGSKAPSNKKEKNIKLMKKQELNTQSYENEIRKL